MTSKKLPACAFALVASFALLAGCAAAKKNGSAKTSYVYATVARSTIEKTVSSSGTLEAVSSVSVLSQMNGIVEKVYADYNDRVTKGQTLVELNTDMLKLQREEQAAAVAKAQANYDLAFVTWTNQLKLAEKKLISDYDLKSAKTALDVSAAELASAKASLRVIDTQISQYAYIKSPISGIVLSKNVTVGGSVVEGSSSNSSSLFTLAADLKQMQIKASVDEIDIASIGKGQSVKFTVEAISGKTFTGKVKMIQLVPTTSDNVVSYNVIISIDNSDGTLLPGMTAEVEFIVSSEKDVLVVPNAALRYEPTNLSSAEIAKKVQAASLAGMTEEERTAAESAQGPAGNAPSGQSGGQSNDPVRRTRVSRDGRRRGRTSRRRTRRSGYDEEEILVERVFFIERGDLNLIVDEEPLVHRRLRQTLRRPRRGRRNRRNEYRNLLEGRPRGIQGYREGERELIWQSSNCAEYSGITRSATSRSRRSEASTFP